MEKEDKWEVYVYRGFLDFDENLKKDIEEGEVRSNFIESLNDNEILDNIKWLINLALDNNPRFSFINY